MLVIFSVPSLRINRNRSGSKFHTGLAGRELWGPSRCRHIQMLAMFV